MDNIYNRFTFVKALSLKHPTGTVTINDLNVTETKEKPLLHAVVEFRTVHKTYDGSFGFDWYRKEDNRMSYGIRYKTFITSGYKDGKTNLKPDEAINRFLDMYEEIPILLPSRKNHKEREERNYQVPYLSIFSKETVDALNLPKNIVQPRFSITLCAVVEILRNSVLEFEYDTAFFDVTPKILADKSADKGIRQSKTSEITIICKKDLDTDKEIKIYAYPQDRKYKRSLAGKIIVLQNDEKVRKTVNFVLVNVRTNIKNLPNSNNNTVLIELKEINTLRKAMYQCLIIPEIVQDKKLFDLSSDRNFKIIKDSLGTDNYGKYIYHQTGSASTWTDGGIFHSLDYTDCHDYLKREYISKNKSFLRSSFKTIKNNSDEKELSQNIFTAFAFGEDSFLTYRSSSITKSHATEGEVKAIGENTVMLFNSLNSAARADDTALAHEVLHGLGLYHTHKDDDPIPNPEILCTFEKKSTDNYMSYRTIESGAVLAGDEKNTLWRWQWKIVNLNIPSIKNDPK